MYVCYKSKRIRYNLLLTFKLQVLKFVKSALRYNFLSIFKLCLQRVLLKRPKYNCFLLFGAASCEA